MTEFELQLAIDTANQVLVRAPSGHVSESAVLSRALLELAAEREVVTAKCYFCNSNDHHTEKCPIIGARDQPRQLAEELLKRLDEPRWNTKVHAITRFLAAVLVQSGQAERNHWATWCDDQDAHKGNLHDGIPGQTYRHVAAVIRSNNWRNSPPEG